MKKQIRKRGQTTTVSRTLVDEYVLQLADAGISLESLNLLGDLELSDEDLKLTEKELLTKILEDDNYKTQKETIEKYISEFIKADFITQSVHRRSGEELVNSSNENWIDGGVYLYRTREKDKDGNLVEIEDDDTTTSTTTTTTDDDDTTTITVDTTTKNIDTSSYGLSAEEVTVEMDDITHEYKIAWISDLHLMLSNQSSINEQWYSSHSTTFEERNSKFNNSYSILPKIIECLNNNDFDAIVFGGDIMDNYSTENFNYLKEQINKLTNKNVMYLVADHDYLTEMTTNTGSNKAAASLGVSGEIKKITIGKDGDSITLVGQNNSNESISDSSVNTIANYLNSTSNSLFFTHVPVESKTQASTMQQWSRSVHNGQVYYWSSAAISGYNNPSSSYLNALYNSTSLKGVFAGHVHSSGSFELNTGTIEHVFQASYTSNIGVITIKPTGNVQNKQEETKQEQVDDDSGSGTYIKEVDSENYVQMKYVTPDEFQKMVDENDSKIRYKYTIDPDTGYIKIAQLKTVETIETEVSSIINKYFPTKDKVTTVEDVKTIDYKSYIEKYTMPYEFLINLCQVTQNPEFVYHVAKLAMETNIMLVVQDDTTVEYVKTTTDYKYQSFENTSSSSMSGASVTSESNKTVVKEVTTTTMEPHLQVQQANTWSFYEEYTYTKTVNTTTEPTVGPITEHPTLPSVLPDYHAPSEDYEMSYEGVNIPVYNPEYWSGGPWTVEQTYTIETTITDTKYNPGILKNSVEKSKQFLGLLRNATGECSYDCYNNHNLAEQCAKVAVYDDSESAINVAYRIPYATRTETPLNKLTSGEQILYELLGQSLEGDASLSADEDYDSQYKTRMQGLIDHMKYLLTFPPNEDTETPAEAIKTEYINTSTDGEINVDDLIVKTDEPGALRAVTTEELTGIITAMYTGNKKTNALSIVNTLIECQETYKVNAIFILAMAQQESSVGTANTKWVNQHNNWLSWSLGTSYSSPQENVKTVMKSMATGTKYFTQGKITIRDIGYTYCPNTSDYPTQGDGWVSNVTATVKKMYSMIGVSIADTSIDENGLGQENVDYYEVNGCKYPFYKQDSGASWSGNSFASGTMKSKGCSITSIAIVLNGYGQKDVTPETIRSELGGQLADLQTVLNNHGISTQRPWRTLTTNEIITHLQSGRPIIIHVKNISSDYWTTSEHYMVLLDFRNKNGVNQVYVSNPGTVNSSKNGWVDLSLITNNMGTGSILITSYPN